MKDVFTEGVVAILCALVAFLFFAAGIFYNDHQNSLMKYHCMTSAIQHGYTAVEVQAVCSKPTN
jgi:uncharacterized membrane protein